MRVISGSLRGRKIQSVDSDMIRPTMDRSKEGLFSVIHFDVDECVFLDLFAGTGNIGIEAVSRGAKEVDFIDNNSDSIKIINTNLKSMSLEQNVVMGDVGFYVDNCFKKYDIIFLDPPYDFDEEKLTEIVNNIFKKELLNEGGMVILEYNAKKNLNLPNVYKEKKYGISKFYFMGKND